MAALERLSSASALAPQPFLQAHIVLENESICRSKASHCLAFLASCSAKTSHTFSLSEQPPTQRSKFENVLIAIDFFSPSRLSAMKIIQALDIPLAKSDIPQETPYL